jgi:hypothetical protein
MAKHEREQRREREKKKKKKKRARGEENKGGEKGRTYHVGVIP